MLHVRHVMRLAAGCWLAAIGTGCVPWQGCDEPSHLYLNYSDQDSTWEIPVGCEIDVDLAGTASTGYTWMITSSNLPYLQLVDGGFVSRTPAGIGASGIHEFQFAASHAGETQLTFGLFAPGQAEPVDSLAMNFVVRGLPELRTVYLDDADNGEARTTCVGGGVLVELSGYPADAGSPWVVTTSGGPVLRLDSSEFIAGSTAVSGGPGLYQFRFTAVESGQGRIILERTMSGTPIETFAAIIVVD